MDITKNLIQFLPKSWTSYSTGVVARMQWPRNIQKKLNKKFVKTFGIDLSEAVLDLDEYSSIEEIFIRELKPGARKIDNAQVVSPADGKIIKSEKINADLAVQAKGMQYSTRELVFGVDQAPHSFAPSWFQTVYLAPHNYHRVHCPIDGNIKAIRHIPGKLWPVNEKFVNLVPQLFTTNERLVFDLVTPHGKQVYVVMVGALNVGRIVTRHCLSLMANGLDRQFLTKQREVNFQGDGPAVKRGDELGIFMLGSTVVTVFGNESVKNDEMLLLHEPMDVKMGQSLMKSK